jgi:hypothetical protein
VGLWTLRNVAHQFMKGDTKCGVFKMKGDEGESGRKEGRKEGVRVSWVMGRASLSVYYLIPLYIMMP